MRKKIDREAWIKADIAKNSSVLHRVVKVFDGPDAETRQILYIGRDRQEARRVYHSVVCKQNESVTQEAIFDSGKDPLADLVVPVFHVKWSGR